MSLNKYTCPHCLKVLAVGQLAGIIKCKKCGKVITLTTEYNRVQPIGDATTSARL